MRLRLHDRLEQRDRGGADLLGLGRNVRRMGGTVEACGRGCKQRQRRDSVNPALKAGSPAMLQLRKSGAERSATMVPGGISAGRRKRSGRFADSLEEAGD
jgi:hypothetical protein